MQQCSFDDDAKKAAFSTHCDSDVDAEQRFHSQVPISIWSPRLALRLNVQDAQSASQLPHSKFRPSAHLPIRPRCQAVALIKLTASLHRSRKQADL